MKNLISVLVAALLPMIAIAAAPAAKEFVCPECGQACDEKTFDKPGNCPGCGMALIEKADRHPTPKVAVLLFDGAEIIDYAGPWEAFGETGFKVFSVSEDAKPIKAVFGQTVVPDYTFANCPKADIILVPGGSHGHAAENAKLITWLQSASKDAQYVMSVCTGAFILSRAGLLDGLSATTVSGAIDELGKVSPKTKVVKDQRYVDNGKVITTAGLSSGIDGAFHLISRIKGQGAAQLTALGMEYRWDPESKFVRAALADQYFPEIDGIQADLVSTEGDSDHWVFKALISQPNSPAAILDLLGKRVVSSTGRARGPVQLVSAKLGEHANDSTIHWSFQDEQGRNWNGSGEVDASDKPGKFLVTLKLARESGNVGG